MLEQIHNEDEFRYVLWVRHCKACHNDKTFFREQPLCTENGINQALEFGKQFSKINEVIQEALKEKKVLKNIDNYQFYSSPLARAMETAKLISVGINNSIRKQISGIPFLGSLENNIIRIGGVQEETDTGLKSNISNISKKQNSITQILSNEYANFLNENIQNGKPISLSKPINPSHEYITKSKQELKSNYQEFINDFLSNEDIFKDKINLIVSHSAFMKENLKLKCRLNNLDSIFCIYKKGETEPIKKYLILFQDLVLKSKIPLQSVDDVTIDKCYPESGFPFKKNIDMVMLVTLKLLNKE